MQVVATELTRRLEQAEIRCWWSALSELAGRPGNPWDLELRRIGDAWVTSCPKFPGPGFFNRVMCAGAGDTPSLEAAFAHFQQRGVQGCVEVAPGDQDDELIEFLHSRGLQAKVFCSVLYGEPSAIQPAPAPGVTIRLAETAADVALVTRLHREGMGGSAQGAPFRADMAMAAHALPQWRQYIAEVDGEPAAQAWLHMDEGVGCLVAGATLPAFRGRGLQTALIRRRIADAAAHGCDLVCSQTDPVTGSQHNLERAGFRMAYTKVEFHPATAART